MELLFLLTIRMVLLLFRNKVAERRSADVQRTAKGGDILKVSSPFAFLTLLVLFSLVTLQLKAQEINIGIPIIQEHLPENYSYNPLFLTTRFPIFSKKENRLQYFVEPQLALTFPPENIPSAFEFGSNLGIQYTFWKGKQQYLAAALGVGPHYTSLETAIQHKGFLFSDNIEIGYYQSIQDNWGIQIKGRFRHLSNANLLQPNKGLDNFFVMVGVFWQTK